MAGLSGNMLVAALIDLGASERRVLSAMESVKDFVKGCGKLRVSAVDVSVRGVKAKRLLVDFEDEGKSRRGLELVKAAEECASSLGLPKRARDLALGSIRSLVEAEARIHGKSPEDVELHESGSVDTLADVAGAAAAAEELGLLEGEVYSTPVAVGKGLTKFSHGVFPVPAPATLEILRRGGFALVGGPAEGELTTPTGAALLVNLASRSLPAFPPMIPEGVGYGAGSKEFKEAPNLLRVVAGRGEGEEAMDFVYLLETNLDDVAGEVVGYAVEKLMKEGAKDASVVPIFAKKGRPGYILKVISDQKNLRKLVRLIMEETGTLGVRVIPCVRHLALRRKFTAKVDLGGGVGGEVAFKVARGEGDKLIQVKPEYEDLKRLAVETGEPLRKIYLKALKEGEKALRGEGTRV